MLNASDSDPPPSCRARRSTVRQRAGAGSAASVRAWWASRRPTRARSPRSRPVVGATRCTRAPGADGGEEVAAGAAELLRNRQPVDAEPGEGLPLLARETPGASAEPIRIQSLRAKSATACFSSACSGLSSKSMRDFPPGLATPGGLEGPEVLCSVVEIRGRRPIGRDSRARSKRAACSWWPPPAVPPPCPRRG